MVSTTITDILNDWADFGVFAYILPFLMIFALVFGILTKTKILGENKAVQATIALTIGLLSLQFDIVSEFFANIFPYAGIGIAILLVGIILIGLLGGGEKETTNWIIFAMGAIIFLTILYVVWNDYSDRLGWGFGTLGEGMWNIVWVLVVVGIAITIIVSSSKKDKDKPKG